MIRRCSLFNSPCSSSNVVFTSFPPLASFAEIGFVRGRPGKWFSACTLLGHGEPLHPGIRPCDGARQRGDPRPARMGSRPAGRLGPCRTALRDELALPSDVVGPRLQRPFRRLGSRLASLIMPAPMASFVRLSFYRDSRLYARRHHLTRALVRSKTILTLPAELLQTQMCPHGRWPSPLNQTSWPPRQIRSHRQANPRDLWERPLD